MPAGIGKTDLIFNTKNSLSDLDVTSTLRNLTKTNELKFSSIRILSAAELLINRL